MLLDYEGDAQVVVGLQVGLLPGREGPAWEAGDDVAGGGGHLEEAIPLGEAVYSDNGLGDRPIAALGVGELACDERAGLKLELAIAVVVPVFLPLELGVGLQVVRAADEAVTARRSAGPCDPGLLGVSLAPRSHHIAGGAELSMSVPHRPVSTVHRLGGELKLRDACRSGAATPASSRPRDGHLVTPVVLRGALRPGPRDGRLVRHGSARTVSPRVFPSPALEQRSLSTDGPSVCAGSVYCWHELGGGAVLI